MKENENYLCEIEKQLGAENLLFEIIMVETETIKNKMIKDAEQLNKVLDAGKKRTHNKLNKVNYLRLSVTSNGNALSARARWYVRMYKKGRDKKYPSNSFLPLKNNKTLWRDVAKYKLEYWENDAFLMVENTLRVLRRKMSKLNVLQQGVEKLCDKDITKRMASEYQTAVLRKIIKEEGFDEVVSKLLINIAQKNIRICEQIIEDFFKDRGVCLEKQKDPKYHHLLPVLSLQTNNWGARLRWCENVYYGKSRDGKPRRYRKYFNKGWGDSYQLQSMDTKKISDWEIHLFKKYEPELSKYRKIFKVIGQIKKTASAYSQIVEK